MAEIDRERTIKELKHLAEVDRSPFVRETANKALALLKEQEPVKAKDCADIVDGIQVGYCPKCDRKIVWNPEKEETVAFCKYCGQAVKWSD